MRQALRGRRHCRIHRYKVAHRRRSLRGRMGGMVDMLAQRHDVLQRPVRSANERAPAMPAVDSARHSDVRALRSSERGLANLCGTLNLVIKNPPCVAQYKLMYAINSHVLFLAMVHWRAKMVAGTLQACTV